MLQKKIMGSVLTETAKFYFLIILLPCYVTLYAIHERAVYSYIHIKFKTRVKKIMLKIWKLLYICISLSFFSSLRPVQPLTNLITYYNPVEHIDEEIYRFTHVLDQQDLPLLLGHSIGLCKTLLPSGKTHSIHTL